MGLEMCSAIRRTSQDHINYEAASFQSIPLDSGSMGSSHPLSTKGTKKHWDASRAFYDTILWGAQTHPTQASGPADLMLSDMTFTSSPAPWKAPPTHPFPGCSPSLSTSPPPTIHPIWGSPCSGLIPTVWQAQLPHNAKVQPGMANHICIYVTHTNVILVWWCLCDKWWLC